MQIEEKNYTRNDQFLRFQVTHNTAYQYMDKVFLEPHVIRLTPRKEDHVKIVSRHLHITPEPSGLNHIMEMDGTFAEFVWFKGMTNSFDINIEMTVETKRFNPFEFLIYPAACFRLPMSYPIVWSPLLGPYMKQGKSNADVKKYANDIARQSDFDTVSFLSLLSKSIYEEFQYEAREEGPPHRPEEIIAIKKGSCRDFSVLAMAACRELGLSSRYVSGYYLNDNKDDPGELHAWIEVFLPGAGWKGIDPAHGIICDHHYLALCASADPSMTLPVTGSYRGSSNSRMKTNVIIRQAS